MLGYDDGQQLNEGTDRPGTYCGRLCASAGRGSASAGNLADAWLLCPLPICANVQVLAGSKLTPIFLCPLLPSSSLSSLPSSSSSSSSPLVRVLSPHFPFPSPHAPLLRRSSMALHLAKNATLMKVKNPVVHLYRSMIKELPKVLSIYDIDLPLPFARNAIRQHFMTNHSVKDPRVVTMLVSKGYMELEETLLQWKQKAQLMRVFEKVGENRSRKPIDKRDLMKNFLAGTEER